MDLFFYIIEGNELKGKEYIDNSAAQTSSGAGIKAALLVADQKADVLITPRCGDNAANVIKAANIEIYQTLSNDAESELNKYLQGELISLSEIHPGFHNLGK